MTPSDREDDQGPGTDADGTIQAEYDWSSLSPSIAVIETVAIAANREPTALEPLHKTVDPDALNELLDSRRFHSTDGVTTVSFVFAGYDVTVQNNGMVVVQLAEPQRESE
ncbi:HalOD1 output domain-containing protein (plasmid) [Haloferax sp. S1W]|uniref:HalOD1 output domain-containing protein n=1 Tax=Haloferax sp. S1W TaxID=3377110 RepID=UPI0037C71BC3